MSPASQASYAAKKRSDHQVRAIRASMLLAPDSPRPRPGGDKTADGTGADVVALPPSRPRRDRTERLGAIVPLDANNRVFATKLLAALGWDTDTELVAEVRGNTAVVRVGGPDPGPGLAAADPGRPGLAAADPAGRQGGPAGPLR